MKEVKTEKFVILGKDWRGTIEFDSKRELFVMKTPRHVKEVAGRMEVSGKTLEALRKEFSELVKEYGELVASRRKVIVFRVNAHVKREEGDPGEEHFAGGGRWNAKAFDMAGKLKLQFFIGYETTKGEEKEYKDELGMRPERELFDSFYCRNGEPPRGVHVVDWSAEREAFFRSMLDGIEKAKKRLDAIFDHEKAEDIMSLVDAAGSGQVLIGLDKEPVR
jgi:hypothetical protein